jgi:hypothetical protein
MPTPFDFYARDSHNCKLWRHLRPNMELCLLDFGGLLVALLVFL